jgi:hypothetical protein
VDRCFKGDVARVYRSRKYSKMDKIVMIAAIIAVIAIIGVGVMLNQPAPKQKSTTPATTAPAEEDDGQKVTAPRKSNITYTNTSYGVQLDELEGNCKLYKHVVKDEYKCFGTAGNYSTLVTNEYGQVTSETYFCKPTIYGCRLYEKVYIQPS